MLDKEDAEQLKLLNEAVKTAMAARTAWLDERMSKYARYQIGEMLYDLGSGCELGEVISYYRYAANHDPMRDTRMDLEYKMRRASGVIDNTSRHGGAIRIGNRAELEQIRR